MGLPSAIDRYTFDDFCRIIKDGEKGDLINGVIYMSSPDNTDANDLFVWMLRLIGDIAEVYELGKVYGSRVAFRLEESHGPEPDIAFVRTDRLHLVEKGFVAGAPDLALEIVSPDSVERDYVLKREQYRQAGVPEYWIVDEMQECVTLLQRNAAGAYREVKSHNGVLYSQALPGFWLRPAWLWQQPRPKKIDVLAEILKTPQPPKR